MKRFSKEHFKPMPWKNGGGITSELFIYREPSQSEFKLRLSMATVSQDGPFSLFPNVDRTLLIIKGKGCRLSFSDKSIDLRSGDLPFDFSGEEVIHCSLIQGEIQDFNVMIDRTWGKALTRYGEVGEEIRGLNDWMFVYDLIEETLTQLSPGEDLTLKNKSIVVNVRKFT